MKINFKNIKITNRQSAIYYIYGNYKQSVQLLLQYICENFKAHNIPTKKYYLSANNFVKSNTLLQEDLFSESISCIHIGDIEDHHLEQLISKLQEISTIYILESGHFLKSKKVTDFFLNSDKYYAIPSFNNAITLSELIQWIIPNITKPQIESILKLIHNGNENLYFLLTKIMLIPDVDLKSLIEYTVSTTNSWHDLESIQLIRYLISIIIKNKITNTHQQQVIKYLSTNTSHTITNLINAEIKIKNGINIQNSYIFQNMLTKTKTLI